LQFFPNFRLAAGQKPTCDELRQSSSSQVGVCSTCGRRKSKIWKKLKKFPKFGRNHVAPGSSGISPYE